MKLDALRNTLVSDFLSCELHTFDQNLCWFSIIKIIFQKHDYLLLLSLNVLLGNVKLYFLHSIFMEDVWLDYFPSWVINNCMHNCLITILLNMTKQWSYVLSMSLPIGCSKLFLLLFFLVVKLLEISKVERCSNSGKIYQNECVLLVVESIKQIYLQTKIYSYLIAFRLSYNVI